MVSHIDVEQVDSLAERDEVVIIDCLPKDDYERMHIPGAVNIPYEDPETFARRAEKTIPDKGTTIVTYCLDEDCELSPAAAHVLEDHLGYSDVREFDGGIKAWRRAGNEYEGTGPKRVKR